MGRPIARPQLRRICEVSGGNPLYALAIAAELVRTRGRDVGPAELPLPALSQKRWHVGSNRSMPGQQTRCLSRPPFRVRGWRVQSVLPDFALGDLDSAARTGVIGLMATVCASLIRCSPPRITPALSCARRELHRLLADALEDESERAITCARRRRPTARSRCGSSWPTGCRSAGRAGRRCRTARTGVTADTAYAEDARRSRLIAAAELHFAGGDAIRAHELLEEVLPDLPHGPTRARALLQLAIVRTDDLAASQALLEEALGDAGDHHRLRAEIELELASTLGLRAEFMAAVVAARAAVESAERTNDAKFLAVMTAYFITDSLFMAAEQLTSKRCGEASSSRTPFSCIRVTGHPEVSRIFC